MNLKKKKNFRNLVALNDNSDPGWEAITHMKQFIIDKIKANYQQFITEEQANETPSKKSILITTNYIIFLILNSKKYLQILDKNNRHPQNKHKRNISLSQQIELQVCYIMF